jgi:3-oxoacyl-[acyl-carrier protein] reductase
MSVYSSTSGQAQKRVAIVTGGTRGMGLAITRSLAQSGMSVLAVFRTNQDKADKALESFIQENLNVAIYQADVSNQEETAKVAEFAGNRWGQIDILVNNAGIFDFCFLEDMTEAFFDHINRVNLKSMIFMIQAVLPWMKKRHYGRIVNATSISGNLADVGLIAYACSKAGVNLLTRVSSGELAPYGITVNAYAPGIIHTDMTDAMIQQRGDHQIKQIPAGYFGKSEEVAALVHFLCSEEASYITGEIIGVDGGMMKVQNPYRAYTYAAERESEQTE